MGTAFTFRQTELGPTELTWLQARADSGEPLSFIARAACHEFGWLRPTGEPPITACSVMLRRLARRGLLRIPTPALRRPGGSLHRDTDRLRLLDALGPVPGMVECQPSGPFLLRPIAPEERDGFRLHLQRYHYLGFQRSVGESMQYAAFLGEELVGLLDWGAAVLHCGPRDRHIGWADAQREQNLAFIVENRRFLIPPWVHVPHLASRILGANLRRLSRDWEERYRHPVLLAETFVGARFRGTCYRASNWLCVGQTRGFSRRRGGFVQHGRPKSVWLYPLARDAWSRLREA